MNANSVTKTNLRRLRGRKNLTYKICRSDSKISAGKKNYKRSKTSKQQKNLSTTTMTKSKSSKICTAKN